MAQLIVLADDWGRHPSACQHLVHRLSARHPTVWVNTIGMRRPTWSRQDAAKITRRLRAWLVGTGDDSSSPHNLEVVAPSMWPSFRRAWARRLNGALIGRSIAAALPRSAAGGPRILLTTLPIAAALVEHVQADAWIYYCVDDFAAWPALDAETMRSLEHTLIGRADHIIATSEVLQRRLGMEARRPVSLLTHGVDLGHWRSSAEDVSASFNGFARVGATALSHPVALFWGLIDRRLDMDWLRRLANALDAANGSLVLVGPQQQPAAALRTLPRVVLPGAVAYEELPRWAAAADVLIMPYADSAVTRAMQPLKLKEYLSTRKPVVLRRLPSTVEWADAADVVDSADAFASTVLMRAREGAPDGQLEARRRLQAESWEAKAAALEAVILDCQAKVSVRGAGSPREMSG